MLGARVLAVIRLASLRQAALYVDGEPLRVEMPEGEAIRLYRPEVDHLVAAGVLEAVRAPTSNYATIRPGPLGLALLGPRVDQTGES